MKLITYVLILIICSAASFAANIIITPDSLYEKALELKQLHAAQSIESEIVNISYINSDFNDNIQIPITGSDTMQLPYSNYNKQLAKKIMDYLQQSSFTSVTLFGDSSFIPPSYYVYDENGADTMDRWIPTDYFYSENLGRIPIKNTNDADNYISKLEKWYSANSSVSIALAGSDISDNYRYYGELLTNEIAEKLAGNDITKLYSSDSKFRKQEIKNILEDDDYRFFYVVGHGSINSLVLDDGTLSSADILSLQESSFQPVVFSSLCSNGAFDTQITGQSQSIGEAMIVSGSGSTVFIGSSRLSYGLPVISYTDGTIGIEETSYMTELIERMFDSYKSGKTAIGDIAKDALDAYKAANSMSDSTNKRTLYEFTLLGDPTLKFPQYTEKTALPKPQLTAVNPTTEAAIPYYAIADGESISIAISPQQPQSTNFKILRDGNFIISSTGAAEFLFSPIISGYYLAIAENRDSRETRMLLNVTAGVIKNIFSLDTPAEFDLNESERNIFVEKQFTVTNNGNANLSNVNIIISGQNISVFPASFSLKINESVNISIRAFIPLNASSGLQQIGTLVFSTVGFCKTADINSDAKNNIQINQIKVKVDGNSETIGSDTSVVDAEAGSDLVIETELENLMSAADIKTAVIKADIPQIKYDFDKDSYEDMEDESDEFSVGSSDTEKASVRFKIPALVDDGKYNVHMVVEAEDDNGAKYLLERGFVLNIDKKKHNVGISAVDFDVDEISCSSFTELGIKIANIGEEDEDVTLRIESPDMDMDIKKDIFLSADISEDTNTYSETVEFNALAIKPGVYPISILLDIAGSTEDQKDVTLKVLKCSEEEQKQQVSETEIAAQQNAESLNQQVFTTKESFKDTSTYKTITISLAVLWIGFIIFVIGAVIIIISKRK
jgi:hypothetical protein